MQISKVKHAADDLAVIGACETIVMQSFPSFLYIM